MWHQGLPLYSHCLHPSEGQALQPWVGVLHRVGMAYLSGQINSSRGGILTLTEKGLNSGRGIAWIGIKIY